MPVGSPVPDPSSASSRIDFQIKSPTNSGAAITVSMQLMFPTQEIDPTLTEAQKNSVIQKLVDFFSGLQNVVPPVTGAKQYSVSQTITPTP